MTNDLDIDKEYERIFGKKERSNIFGPDDDEYNNFRKEIIVSKREYNLEKTLPFNDIKVVPQHSISIQNEYHDSLNHEVSLYKSLLLGNIIAMLKNRVNTFVSETCCCHTLTSAKHLFYIKKQGVCDATGFYEEKTDSFYIGKDSLINASLAVKNTKSTIYKYREDFIYNSCVREGEYYRVLRDTKCISASNAACILLGKITMYSIWIDGEGKLLNDYYPNKFKGRKNNIDLNSSILHKFFIKRKRNSRSCNAVGYYDIKDNTFVLQSESVLSLETTSSFYYSPVGLYRRKFIEKYCTKEKNGYRLKKDIQFSSPSNAASIVLGGLSNGWNVWKDEFGNTLDSVYRNSV